LSGLSMSSSFTVMEFNLFRNCGGDPETVSIKSSDNVFRYNTFRGVPGELTLRHGNRNLVYGNYILGDGTATDHGIRVLGQDHKIFNNYIQGVPGSAIFLEGGTSDDNSGALTDFKQVFRAQVVHNTVVNAHGIQIGGAHPLNPVDCVIANNIVQGSGSLIDETGATNPRYLSNIVFGGGGLMKPADQIRVVDPMLVKVGDVFKIAAGSPAVDAANGSFSFVTDDIDGKIRSTPDVGADELSPLPATHRMLNETDVGPDSL
jgi:poly(beta-D-mannuronate) lyase